MKPSSSTAAARTATAISVGGAEAAAENLLANLHIGEKNVDTTKVQAEGATANAASASIDGVDDSIMNRPTILVMIGMAGAGKTTLANRLIATLIGEDKRPYVVNLDPACRDPPYPVNIDIRDTVDYKKVMENYKLGPNGAIVTALNMFSTKIKDVVHIIQQKKFKPTDYVIVDTPGQIEVFMWSASGQIILQSFASRFRTIILYVTDLTRNINPITFVSNMTYGLSIFYKSRLPIVIVLNKCDQLVQEEGDSECPVAPAKNYAERWMTDFDEYQRALQKCDGYSSNLAASLSLGLDEFYSKFGHVSVSATTGHGIAALFGKVVDAGVEYETVFLPEFTRELQEQKKREAAKAAKNAKKQELKKLARSMVRPVPSKKSRLDGTKEDDENPSLFSAPSTSAAVQGFTLTMGDEDDEDSETSDEEVYPESDDNEEDKKSFREFFEQQMQKKGPNKP